MNYLSRILPVSIGLSAVLSFALTSQVHAFGGPPGGPFSNGSYFSNEGTFSAVVRGENLTGTLQFSTTAGAGPINTTTTNGTSASSGTGGVGSTGVATIYYEGDTYQGNSQGAYNAQASSLTVNFQADVPGQGQQTIEVQTPVTTQVTTLVENPITGVVTPVQTEETQILPTRQILYYDALYLNGFADCKTSNAFPNQKFKGSGQAEFQQLIFTGDTPFLDAVSLPISITGVRLSDTAATFNSSEVRAPSVNEFSVLIQ
jgi:hypothetical protein